MNLTIHGIIEQHARQTPHATAFCSTEQTPLTYAQLYELIKRTARQLQAAGIQHNDPVALVVRNRPDLASAIMAVSAYAACAPLNPDYRAAEFEQYFSALRTKALIIDTDQDEEVRRVAERLGMQVFELISNRSGSADHFELHTPNAKSSSDASLAVGENLALLMHTSGTTAEPKIVALTHKNLWHGAQNSANAMQLTATDLSLNFLPLIHIHGIVGAMLACHARGGTVVCTDYFDSAQFMSWLEKYRPTYYTASPTFHLEIARVAESYTGARPTSLRLIRSASGPLPEQLRTRIEQIFDVPMINCYGMTEASPLIASNPLPPEQRKPNSVGRPIGCQVRIVGELGEDCPVGKTGEIWIRGPNVIQAYYKCAQVDEYAFDNGWLRSGDTGYLDQDGYLFITGREKELINRGGTKISPLEIDHVLLKHTAVTSAASFAIAHPSLGQTVAAVVVLKEGHTTTEDALRTFVAESLADFKVPQRILLVEDIPVGTTGKIRRDQLAQQLNTETAVFSADLADDPIDTLLADDPIDTLTHDIETAIADIWCQVLDLKQVHVHDNFFLLGGDSLSAVRALSRIKAKFGIIVQPREFFDQPTVKQIAAQVSSKVTQ